MKHFTAKVLAGSVLLSSCGVSEKLLRGAISLSDKYAIEKIEYEIVGGSLLNSGHPGSWSAVAILGGQSICSGTLIASNIVLTAAHCFDRGISEYVYFGSNIFQQPVRRKIIEKQAFLQNNSSFPNYDIAWVRFQGTAPRGYRPIDILGSYSNVSSGTKVTLVGYGRTSDNARDSGKRLTVDSTIKAFFDDARYHGLFVVGPNPGRGPCKGDSGGPAYYKEDGKWFLLGVTNGVEARLTPELTCQSGHSVYTFAGAYKNWIRQTAGIELN